MEVELTGDLHETQFSVVASFLAQRRATGVLEIQDSPGNVSRAFFLDGGPQGARLANMRFPLGKLLVDEKLITEANLKDGLEEQQKTGKLLGQVLVDMKVVDDAALAKAFLEQSRKSFLSLFGLHRGRLEFQDGIVHLTDFTSSPMKPLVAIYEGVRDYDGGSVVAPLLARLAFASIRLSEVGTALVNDIAPPEQNVLLMLTQPIHAAELARRSSMKRKSLGALIYALHALAGLNLVAP